MEKYCPNFQDPRFRKRALKAIAFCDKFLRTDRANELYSGWIHHKNHLGITSNPSSRYLKNLLLICVDQTYRISQREDKSDGRSKKYILNQDGMQYLKEQLGLRPLAKSITINEQTALHPTFQEHIDEFQSGNFQTSLKSHREYHACIQLPREIKNSNFPLVGLPYNSDIRCASMRLLYQLAKKSGLNKNLWAIEYYIENTKLVRNRICDLLEFTNPNERQLVKQILAGLINGSYISKDPNSAMVKLLNSRYILIERLQRDLFLTRFREELRIMWTSIKSHREIKGRLNSKQKSEIYMIIEEQVRNSVKRYMKKRGIRIFPEHDGWRTSEMYDILDLIMYVKNQTGYHIEIDWEKSH